MDNTQRHCNPGDQDVLKADALPALQNALEEDQDDADQESEAGELTEVAGAGDHGHRIQDGGQIGRVANGVDLPHGASSVSPAPPAPGRW
jgi:hypothetical protein